MKGKAMKMIDESKMTPLAKRLWTYLKRNPMNSTEIGNLIGIQHATVLGLLRGKEPRMKVRLILENFLEKQEQQTNG